MKLSNIVFFIGLSSLTFSCIIFWQRTNATPTRQTYQMATIARPTPITSSPTVSALAALVQPSTLTVAPSSTAPAPPPAVASQANFQTITACNGQSGNANFRAVPSLDSGNVLGVVAQGHIVHLTGRTAVGIGGLWYEAIAPGALFPSTDPHALNRVQAGQAGWISGCFVSR